MATTLPELSARAVPLQQMVLAALRRNTVFFSVALPRQIVTPMFNRYGVSDGHLGNHGDVAMRFKPDGRRVRNDVSCTLFLSEREEYKRGELVIADYTNIVASIYRLGKSAKLD